MTEVANTVDDFPADSFTILVYCDADTPAPAASSTAARRLPTDVGLP